MEATSKSSLIFLVFQNFQLQNDFTVKFSIKVPNIKPKFLSSNESLCE